MKRMGMLVVPVISALILQGCLFLPAETAEMLGELGATDAQQANDPFFFDSSEHSTSGDFAEVGNFQPDLNPPPLASRNCAMEPGINGIGPACWFFPVMRIY
ncbi:hypothetical protein Maes01_02627 [Microbulbifer aestuariivivens]|uniref:Uncharacterized protein n=1 Tax=Microbulbifer aestuariivivens TaxID=1908308 RepID=A0ABP9WS62_9GAMM